ncbi:MAG TPA: ABA4-like family protein [Gemmataceae bacterium]|jgi:hypothetical protein|nr:ABA4-like family protein [Gemmataceae bacterium]
MDNNTLFLIMSGLAGIGWVLLILISPCWKNADKVVMSIIVAIFGLAYGYFNFANLGDVGGLTAFMSYEGVQKVFANAGLQLAAWAHILGIDLLAGVWMYHNAKLCKVKHLVMIPIYLVTIMLGPVGVLLYLIVRALRTTHWFAANEGI